MNIKVILKFCRSFVVSAIGLVLVANSVASANQNVDLYGRTYSVPPYGPITDPYYRERTAYQIPLHLSDQDIAIIAATTAATFIVFTSEEELKDFVQRSDGRVVRQAANFGRRFGEKMGLAAAGLSMVYAVLVNDKSVSQIVPIQLKAMLVSSLVNDALKLSIHRALPRDSTDPFDRGKSWQAPSLAFPSGHTSAAFSFATIVAENAKDSKIIPVLAYGAATLTAWSRVKDNQHWVSDVLAGFLVGHYVTKAVITAGESRRNLQVIPFVSGRTAGVQVQYTDRSNSSSGCGGNAVGMRKLEICIHQALRPQ